MVIHGPLLPQYTTGHLAKEGDDPKELIGKLDFIRDSEKARKESQRKLYKARQCVYLNVLFGA